jgi:hypothetical protein
MARANPATSKSVGKSDTQSRAKAKAAAERAEQQQSLADPEGVPHNAQGRPMMKILMTASELVPTGQYANVSVGPAQIVDYIDPDRELSEDDDGNKIYYTPEEREVMAAALNELAEVVEADVVAVQRNLVMESIQEQAASANGGK